MKRKGNSNHSSRNAKKSKTSSVKEEDSALYDFFLEQLKDIYWAEKQLVKTLPKLSKSATTLELREALTHHQTETEKQVMRLEEAFNLLGEKPKTRKCDGMDGLTREGQHVISDTEKGSFTRDTAIIMSAQKVEHYEIATYGGLAELARILGKAQVVKLLQETLEEEKEADKKLTAIAESRVNEEAEAEV
ncbi:MAG: ferritin-like domain-containing protein [Bacteroidota bacterium]